MRGNFLNRILTSIFLLIIFLFCLFTQKILWTFLLIAAAILSFFEFNNLVKKNLKIIKIIFYHLIFYHFFICVYLYLWVVICFINLHIF